MGSLRQHHHGQCRQHYHHWNVHGYSDEEAVAHENVLRAASDGWRGFALSDAARALITTPLSDQDRHLGGLIPKLARIRTIWLGNAYRPNGGTATLHKVSHLEGIMSRSTDRSQAVN